MSTILIRTFIIYTALGFAMKLMGKRQVGEFQISELITTLLLSELASLPMTDPDIPLLYVALPVLLIISIEVVTSFLTMKSVGARKLIVGKPAVIVCRGALDQRELYRLRISVSELLGQMRQNGISDIADVEYAIVEDDGRVSVFPKRNKRPPHVDEFDKNGAVPPEPETGVAHALIVDGKIIKENLKTAGRTQDYVRCELSARKLSAREVLLLTADDAGNVNVIKKERHR
ncbi:MAG: DUF421 domain-containing protein [Clostridiales bacterium]|nr:DUF421 domain-containing protein [Clostridiales bacterium]